MTAPAGSGAGNAEPDPAPTFPLRLAGGRRHPGGRWEPLAAVGARRPRGGGRARAGGAGAPPQPFVLGWGGGGGRLRGGVGERRADSAAGPC